MSQVFSFPPDKAAAAAAEIEACAQNMDKIVAMIDEAIIKAGSNWEGNASNGYLGEVRRFAKDAKPFPKQMAMMISNRLAANVENYQSAETIAKDSMESIMSAFS